MYPQLYSTSLYQNPKSLQSSQHYSIKGHVQWEESRRGNRLISIYLFMQNFQKHNHVTTLLNFTWLHSKSASGFRAQHMLKKPPSCQNERLFADT